MMRIKYRTIFINILINLLFLTSFPVMALSLGDIDVKSSFGEAFLAEISLPSYTDKEIESIEISLASAKQHDAMGYAVTKTTKRFRFTIKENIQGRFYIEVRSLTSIKELSVSLLIEIMSSSGRIIKGYDILLTPKAISEKNQDRNTATSTISQTMLLSEKIISPVTKKTALTNKKVVTPVKKSFIRELPDGSLEYVNVGSGVTLSSIANAIRPNKSIHISQVIAALHQQNPNAFINNNINRLKMGANLKLTTNENKMKMSQIEATNYIQNQKNKRNKLSKKESFTKTTAQKKQSNKKVFLAAAIKDETQQKAIGNLKSELNTAQKLTKELEEKNKDLVVMISNLEVEIKKMTQTLIQEPENKIVTARIDDPLIVRTHHARPRNESSIFSRLEENFVPAFLASILVILVILLIIKRENIKSFIEEYKAKKDRNMFN